eukprot:g5519.t1
MTSAYPIQDQEGIFNRKKTENPFHDWTIVHVLYCTGDMHSGDVVREYTDKAGVPVEQRGAINTRAVINWIKAQPEFDTNKELIVAGSSAGAVAAQIWGDILLTEIKHENASIVADSFIGVYPGDKTLTGRLIYNFGTCSTELLHNNGAALKGACEEKTLTQSDFFELHMKNHPSVGFFLIIPKADPVEEDYYSALALTELKQVKHLSHEEYYFQANTIAEKYGKYPNYRHFMVNTSKLSPAGGHCTLIWSTFLTTSTKGTNDKSAFLLKDWLSVLPVNMMDSSAKIHFECSGKKEVLSNCKSFGKKKLCGEYYCDAMFPLHNDEIVL